MEISKLKKVGINKTMTKDIIDMSYVCNDRVTTLLSSIMTLSFLCHLRRTKELYANTSADGTVIIDTKEVIKRIDHRTDKVLSKDMKEVIESVHHNDRYTDKAYANFLIICNYFAKRDSKGYVEDWDYDKLPINVNKIEDTIDNFMSIGRFWINIRALPLSKKDNVFNSPSKNIFYKYYKDHFPNYFKVFEILGVKRTNINEIISSGEYNDVMDMVEEEKDLETLERLHQKSPDSEQIQKFLATLAEKRKKNKIEPEDDPYSLDKINNNDAFRNFEPDKPEEIKEELEDVYPENV